MFLSVRKKEKVLPMSRLVQLLKKAKEGPMGTIIEKDGIYLELGMRCEMYFLDRDHPSGEQMRELGEAAFGTYIKVMQATIRVIILPKKLQRKKEFTALVKYLLERDGAVHLEAVHTRWLVKRLEESPLWIRQTNPKDMFHGSRYLRLQNNTPFTLF